MAHRPDPPAPFEGDRDQLLIISFAQLANRIRRAAPRLGPVRLTCVDGRSGAGKTTFAARLSAALDHCQVIHADDLYPGWHGLDAFGDRLQEWVLTPLLDGEPASYRRYDWYAGQYAERHPVPAAHTLILEGAGVAQRRVDPVAVLKIWLDAPGSVRYRRGIDRDGDGFRPYWQIWAEQEARHFAAHDTRNRADLIVDGDPPASTEYDPDTHLVLREVRRWPERPGEPGQPSG